MEKGDRCRRPRVRGYREGRLKGKTEREVERLERKGRRKRESERGAEKGDRKKRREGKTDRGDKEGRQRKETERGDREGIQRDRDREGRQRGGDRKRKGMQDIELQHSYFAILYSLLQCRNNERRKNDH
jgi:hypothetical protein